MTQKRPGRAAGRPKTRPISKTLGRPGPGRKTLQLCGQIFEVLEQLLAEQEDETLQGLHVVAVTPAPDASNLLVSVSPGPGLNIVAAAEVLQRLEAATKDLRLEVASAITRRRVPGLLWRLV